MSSSPQGAYASKGQACGIAEHLSRMQLTAGSSLKVNKAGPAHIGKNCCEEELTDGRCRHSLVSLHGVEVIGAFKNLYHARAAVYLDCCMPLLPG